MHGEFGERDKAVRCRRNARVKHGGEEAVKVQNGGGKTRTDIGKQLKRCGNPEECKGGWDGVAKDSP